MAPVDSVEALLQLRLERVPLVVRELLQVLHLLGLRLAEVFAHDGVDHVVLDLDLGLHVVQVPRDLAKLRPLHHELRALRLGRRRRQDGVDGVRLDEVLRRLDAVHGAFVAARDGVLARGAVAAAAAVAPAHLNRAGEHRGAAVAAHLALLAPQEGARVGLRRRRRRAEAARQALGPAVLPIKLGLVQGRLLHLHLGPGDEVVDALARVHGANAAAPVWLMIKVRSGGRFPRRWLRFRVGAARNAAAVALRENAPQLRSADPVDAIRMP
mmetsp:Transcript_19266/g.58265  ORF Transcript_19266/g.58265 Transcript_19266/m.58265 type:complete len:269 (+) Transcript_19266:225-1031(+)